MSKSKKITVGLALTKSYDKVTIMFEEDITHDSEQELRAKVRNTLEIIRSEIRLEFSKLHGK